MKTHNLFILIFLVAFTALSACLRIDIENNCIHGKGSIVERVLSVDDFSKFELEGSFDVVVTQGPVQKVLAVGHGNIIDHLNTNVVNQKWDIGLGMGCYNNFELIVYITVPSIDEVKLSGSGNVEIKEFDQDNNLSLSISGSGNISMNEFESAEDLYANLSGSGNINARKSVTCFKTLTVRTSGSGNFNGFPVEVAECTASTLGSGSCYVYAEEKLNATISGSGDIVYKGSPEIDVIDYGSGNLRHSN
jgi:hypothetical protein